MKQAIRNDIHRPAALIPADYTHVLEYGREWADWDVDNGSDEEWSNMTEAGDLYAADGTFIHGPREDVMRAVLRCDVCGARFKYGSLFRHVSGEIVSMGHDCASAVNLAYDAIAAKSIRGKAKRIRKAVIERRARFSGLKWWASQQTPELLAALKFDHKITRSMRSKLISTGARWGLSDRQIPLLLKLASETHEEEVHVATPVGRVEIIGEVVSCKWRDSDYGGAWKMTVKVTTEAGSWLVWGTVPSSIVDSGPDLVREFYADARCEDQCSTREFNLGDALKGRTVRFTGTITQGDDPHFGFFKRPSKASLLPLAKEDSAT